MAKEPRGTSPGRGADPVTREVLSRLAKPAGSAPPDPAGFGDAPQGYEFLPDVPGRALLTLLGAHHRRTLQVGFPDLEVDAA
ncbi:hypothetical protein E4N62_43930 [Streptomyces sp. MNU76]|uniref:hypothetical protein n=1 Tax=Streptomyces sp. MNU76 TaxID=2560026 RepID=UPI001E32E7F5|nr:hypothetical protein [Streptomyces sp. MNU76]MCC9711560.1 hypothetical protein [Streptomyces sp. MNU76]